MVQFIAIIKQFEEKGEKTGWSYIEIPGDVARQIKPGNKKAFRVKGYLDEYYFEGASLLPMGGGDFIMALNATVRRAVKKEKGARLQVRLEADESLRKPPADLVECMADEPKALAFFNSLPASHRNYFSNWITSAKTEPTRIKRIAQSINALSKGMKFSEMIRLAARDY